jgi:hypothetical protein
MLFCYVLLRLLWKKHDKSKLVTTALKDGGVRYKAL